MELEISPRQTGKTNRLVYAMAYRIQANPKDRFILATHSMHYSREVVRKLREVLEHSLIERRFPDIYDRIHVVSHREQYHSLMIGKKKDEKFHTFVDEFDFLGFVPIDEDGFYVTTPKRKRTAQEVLDFFLGKREDALLQLLSMNKGEYVSYPLEDRITNQYKGQICKAQFEAEFEGKFV